MKNDYQPFKKKKKIHKSSELKFNNTLGNEQ